MKKELLEECDLKPAIEAIRILMLETHRFEQCLFLVYKPTEKLLEEEARQGPESLLCFYGKKYRYAKPGLRLSQSGFFSELYLITSAKQILFLGSVLDRKESYCLWQWLLENSPEEQKGILRERGPMKIIRQRMGCRIPTQAEVLTQEAIEYGLRKYLENFAPALSCLPVFWLNKKEAEMLEKEIWNQAKKQAKIQTKQERISILLQEEFEE